ncbi:gustatory and odorant receptor 21a-like [Frankliniella occidentalis]|uniref:Gustatory receptor n=1 Tax=Frankliniella occidentalis TaxID=133901 RepID=A0A9C6U8H2_FRAOC|nr:gustatory and odorant receptor 21a-like [Frankliniella occidentalis]XP_052125543.1 gustatory and odorant receptor 21a-like [Frankliniella occidentalis]XP_052125544.1 gustatory and odorant receptor 21a-like [Frankliniella occidentalis]
MYHQVRHLAVLIKAVGGWPIREEAGGGYAAVPLRSWPAFRCLFIVMLLVSMACAALHRTINEYADVEFVERVTGIFHVLIEISILVVPVFHWRAAHNLASYFNDWRHFEVEWRELTGTPLLPILTGVRTVRVWASLCFAYAVLSIISSSFLSPDLKRNQWKTPLYMAVLLHTVSMAALWSLLNCQVIRVCRALRLHLQHELKSRTALDVERVKHYCLAWLHVRDIFRSVKTSWGSVMSRWFIVVPGSALLALFISFAALINGHYRRTITTLFVSITNAAYVVLVCLSAEAAEKECWRGIRLELLNHPVHKISDRTVTEIFHFLRRIQNDDVKIHLNGNLVVNNSLPVAIIKLMVTWIVVLAQFALSRKQMNIG